MIQAISDLMIHFNFFQFLLRLLNAARLFLLFIHFISVCGFFCLSAVRSKRNLLCIQLAASCAHYFSFVSFVVCISIMLREFESFGPFNKYLRWRIGMFVCSDELSR